MLTFLKSFGNISFMCASPFSRDCTRSLAPGVRDMEGKFPTNRPNSEFAKELTPDEFRCLRKAGTERAGTGEYHAFFPKEGYFACRACKFPLYSSTSKFKDCGWDAFDKCFYTGDNCHVGVQRDAGGLEIICNGCSSHLGHVFYGESQTETDERH